MRVNGCCTDWALTLSVEPLGGSLLSLNTYMKDHHFSAIHGSYDFQIVHNPNYCLSFHRNTGKYWKRAILFSIIHLPIIYAKQSCVFFKAFLLRSGNLAYKLCLTRISVFCKLLQSNVSVRGSVSCFGCNRRGGVRIYWKKPTSEQVKLTEFVTLVSGTGPDSQSEECCEYAAGV